MPRTTSTLVKGILPEEPEVSLSPFIKAANKLVTRCCSPNTEYSDDDLQEIETWLAAHIYSQPNPQTVMEQAGSVQETFQNRIDLGLSNSRFGQFVLRLDWYGGLAALDNAVKVAVDPVPATKKTVSIGWLGTEKE